MVPVPLSKMVPMPVTAVPPELLATNLKVSALSAKLSLTIPTRTNSVLPELGIRAKLPGSYTTQLVPLKYSNTVPVSIPKKALELAFVVGSRLKPTYWLATPVTVKKA